MAWQGAVGIVVFVLLAALASENRRAIPWRTVIVALILQAVTAALLLHVPAARGLFLAINEGVIQLQAATEAGTAFVFGHLGGGETPYEVVRPLSTFILAIQALPIILVMSALSRVLFYWGVLPMVVRGMAWVLRRTLGLGGAVGVATAANAFMGMIEAPLLVRPYLKVLSRGELFIVMTAGMATIAGTVFVLYSTILVPILPDAAGHLLTASMINIVGAVMVAVLLVPPQQPPTMGDLDSAFGDTSTMEALTRGTADGMTLLINIVAMLIVLVALVALADASLAMLPDVGGEPVSLRRLLAVPMMPVAWLIGVPWSEAATAGGLLATKTVLNELLAYSDLAALPADALSSRTRLILVYALSGFANIGSLGIMIGGLCAMVPERRAEVVSLGIKSLVAGTMATCLSGAWVGLLS